MTSRRRLDVAGCKCHPSFVGLL